MLRVKTCAICGKRIRMNVDRKGKYDNGNYFGTTNVPIAGTGEWKKVGKTRMGRRSYDIADWTGKEKKFEYWECNACFEKAGRECWLEEKIEKLYGERCPDHEAGCARCKAWGVYDTIRNEGKEYPKRKS